jgi:hypothetical protein
MRKPMPLAYQALSDWHTVAARTGAEAGLEPMLVELVKIRALAAWHECGELFSRRERAAERESPHWTRRPHAGPSIPAMTSPSAVRR